MQNKYHYFGEEHNHDFLVNINPGNRFVYWYLTVVWTHLARVLRLPLTKRHTLFPTSQAHSSRLMCSQTMHEKCLRLPMVLEEMETGELSAVADSKEARDDEQMLHEALNACLGCIPVRRATLISCIFLTSCSPPEAIPEERPRACPIFKPRRNTHILQHDL